jgi:hypothetical protein
MTPKEKAKKIVDRHCSVIQSWNLDSNFSLFYISKQCALIAVDEILNYLGIIEQNETSDFSFGGSYQGDDYFKYWQEVKHEINQL